MSTAQTGDTVLVHYTGTLSDQTVFDTSRPDSPLEFTIGEGSLIPGFERAVIGMQPGESKNVTIAADDAYGPYQPELLVQVDRSQLPPDLEPEVGDQLQLRQPDGQGIIVTVAELTDSSITLDANHPLAGQDLNFEIELVSIT